MRIVSRFFDKKFQKKERQNVSILLPFIIIDLHTLYHPPPMFFQYKVKNNPRVHF